MISPAFCIFSESLYDMADYIIVLNGKPEGPYPITKLKELGVKADTFVKTDLMDDYKEANELPELRELFNIKYQPTLPQYFPSLDVRLLAVVIDYLIVFAVFGVLMIGVLFILQGKELRTIAAITAMVFIPFGKLIYGSIMESSIRQATYGKILMGIKVTDEFGNRIDLKKGLIRNFSKLLCILTLGFGYLIGFFDKRQQCLHDRIGATLVVKDRLL